MMDLKGRQKGLSMEKTRRAVEPFTCRRRTPAMELRGRVERVTSNNLLQT